MEENKSIESWKDLKVWKISHDLVLAIYKLTKSFPPEEKFRLTDQICRSAISVPTNIAGGKGRNSLREYLQFLSIARGSVEETKYLLLLSKDLGYLSKQQYGEVLRNYDRVGRMLNKLINSLRSHLPSKPKT